MDKATVKIDLLFETSWEVCNKIGGIYTVLSTKAKTLQKLYKDKTIFVGPDVWSEENPSPYFVESKTLLKQWKSQAQLPEGVSVRVGRWDIPGKPIVVLVKFDAMYAVCFLDIHQRFLLSTLCRFIMRLPTMVNMCVLALCQI